MLSLRPIRRLWYTSAAATGITCSCDSVTEKNQIQVTPRLEEPALVRLKAERDPEKLFKLFKANATNRLVVENRFAFEDTVSRLAGACRFDYIEELLEHQKTLPQGRREGFIVRIVMLYGKAGMTKHALDTFHNMHLYGCKRTVKSFNATLMVLSLKPDPVTLQAFFHNAQCRYGIQFDTFSFNIVIKAFCELGILDKAYLVMIAMEKSGLKPDVVTYTTLMSTSYKHNRFLIGNGLWNLMALKGCKPNLASFNVRIQFLVNRRRSWEANDLLLLMPKLEIVPDEITYNLVIKGFCLAGFPEMAKRVYSAMHGDGLKPSVKTYQTMIHYLCKGGEFDLAYTMCKDCMEKNWYPNMATVHTLLKGLVNKRRRKKAKSIIASVRKRVPPLSPEQLLSLQSVLTRD